ncbi:ferredoxin--NADP reductase [Sphingomicrobium lutaoense]|uniref:Ring-1,2-phenylacetyl-CoA epoxidase subunit PaaE n=1 Tax=Sphingomicrobium lutaoense TaxID=515949 RepID=A0A839YY15_9SPHN|nr:ferredoxin--NADP reductase [Sphingomicrobium lutaoense]MBB3764059.1 ring-1,2-phenylacetyl-CoA epoxidase subunit PaaE [Sphingomicrobium lutaoense]
MSEHFHELTVAEITPETEDANSVRFAVPEELAETFAFKAGQHLTLKATIDGEEVRRNYSLCVAPHEGQLKVTVKRIAGGVFSNWVGDHLKEGDRLDVLPPHGSFTYDFDESAPPRHYVAFAGGSGITPIMSLLRTALAREPEARFTLFYGNRDSSSVIFLDQLSDLKDRYMGRFELFHFLSEEAGDVDLFNGMLDRETCDAVIEDLVRDPKAVESYFICGPGPMMDAAEAALLDAGVDKPRIHIERFTAGRPSAAVAAQLAQAKQQASGTHMWVTLDGRARKVEFNGDNILDSAREAGLPAPFACKAGVCATCRARVTEGDVEMGARYGLTDEEIAAGYILTCQSVPKGDGVKVDYDA